MQGMLCLKEGEELTLPPTESGDHGVCFVYQGKVSPKGGYRTDDHKELDCDVDSEKRRILIIRGQTTIECRLCPAQVAWFLCDNCDDATGLTQLPPNKRIPLGETTYVSLLQLTQDNPPAEIYDQSKADGLVVQGKIEVQEGNSRVKHSQGDRFPLTSLGAKRWLYLVGGETAWVFLVENEGPPALGDIATSPVRHA
jgi:hypothetical protein